MMQTETEVNWDWTEVFTKSQNQTLCTCAHAHLTCWCAKLCFLLTWAWTGFHMLYEIWWKEKTQREKSFPLCSPNRSSSPSLDSVGLSVCTSSYLLTWTQSAVAHVFGSCSTALKLCRTWFLLFMKAAMAARWAALWAAHHSSWLSGRSGGAARALMA